MATLNFPDNPSTGDVYTDSNSGFTYEWNGTVWISTDPSTASNIREIDDISGDFDGSDTDFTLKVSAVNVEPVNAQQLIISVGGVMQNAGDDFTVSGSTITFTTPPQSGLSFFGTLLGTALSLNTIADGTVTPSSLTTTSNYVMNGLTLDQGAGIITAFGFQGGSITADLDSTFSGNVSIAGSLTVQGTQTIINVDELNIQDKTIGIGSTNAPSSTSQDGAGAIIYGQTHIDILYDVDKAALGISTAVNISGFVTATRAQVGTGVTINNTGIDAGNAGIVTAGTVAAPSAMSFEAGGSERLNITSAGNVTTSGESTFDRATAGFTARSGDCVSITRANGTPLELTRTTAQGNMINFFDTDGATQRANIGLTANDLIFGLTAEKVRITSDGKVLIGTDTDISGGSAASVLQVLSASGSYLSVGRNDTTVASGNGLGGFRFYSNDTNINSGNYLQVGGISCDADGDFLSGDAPTRLTFSTMTDGTTTLAERLRITSNGGFSFNNAQLVERVEITAGKLSNNTDIDLADGMVHYFSTTETGTSTPNIRIDGSNTLNNAMDTGDVISVTLITTAAAAAYSAALNIDGSSATVEWSGAAAPSAGGASGLDVYAYTIIKIGSGSYKVLGNYTNFD